MPVIGVVDEPTMFCDFEVLSETYPDVFPACAITCTQSQREGDVVDLIHSCSHCCLVTHH